MQISQKISLLQVAMCGDSDDLVHVGVRGKARDHDNPAKKEDVLFLPSLP